MRGYPQRTESVRAIRRQQKSKIKDESRIESPAHPDLSHVS